MDQIIRSLLDSVCLSRRSKRQAVWNLFKGILEAEGKAGRDGVCRSSEIVRWNSGNFDFNPFEKTCI